MPIREKLFIPVPPAARSHFQDCSPGFLRGHRVSSWGHLFSEELGEFSAMASSSFQAALLQGQLLPGPQVASFRQAPVQASVFGEKTSGCTAPRLCPPPFWEPSQGRPDRRPIRRHGRARADSGCRRKGAGAPDAAPCKAQAAEMGESRARPSPCRTGQGGGRTEAAGRRGEKAGPSSGFSAKEAAGAKSLLRHTKFRQNY